MIAPLLKPKDRKRVPRTAWKTKRDGKEICDMKSAKGRAEYRRRTMVMYVRQRARCRWCGRLMLEESATFDHDNGRTKGNQDDRIEVDGKWQNAAVHGICNAERGSMRWLTRAEWQQQAIRFCRLVDACADLAPRTSHRTEGRP